MLAVKIQVIVARVILQRVYVFSTRINVSKCLSVEEIDLPHGGNHQPARFRDTDCLYTVIRQSVRRIIDVEPMIKCRCR